MPDRSAKKYRPDLESLEIREALAGGLAAHAALAHAHALGGANPNSTVSEQAIKGTKGYLVYRITNPSRYNNHINLPMGHVLVQAPQPVPGQVYNVLYVTVRNGTLKTFDASSNFSVRFPGQSQFTPILTGNEQWKPGQNYTFYVLTKKYYPLPNEGRSGFIFHLDGGYSKAIAGPSGIFLRLTYDPAKINNQLDWIVRKGAGAQGGIGIKYGMPDTAIYEFLSAKTNRNDFGGLF